MTPILYNQFFRNLVLRKKQDLVNPVFHAISEIGLPKNSLLHYIPRTQLNMVRPIAKHSLVTIQQRSTLTL